MNCKKVKKLIPIYIEGGLGDKEKKQFEEHISVCLLCSREVEEFKSLWNMLDEIEAIDSREDYISRFWTKVASQNFKRWKIKPFLERRTIYFVSAVFSIFFVIFTFSLMMTNSIEDALISKIDTKDIDMIENIELVSYLDIIEQLDFLESLDLIEDIDLFES